jgi:NhaP-type Na+/H+ or K+/H+ antiporter
VVAIFTIDRWGRRASVGIAAVGCCVGAAGAAVAQSLMRRAIYEDQAGMALVVSCIFVYVGTGAVFGFD